MTGPITPRPPHIGRECPKAPSAGTVHLFCYSGDLREGPWETVAACKWCRITPVGERIVVTRPSKAERIERLRERAKAVPWTSSGERKLRDILLDVLDLLADET